jgi:hypothetical protein
MEDKSESRTRAGRIAELEFLATYYDNKDQEQNNRAARGRHA